MQQNNQDIIAAIATPVGIGAIMVIRVSGENTLKTVDTFFCGKKKLTQAKSHTIQYGKIRDTENNTVDDVLVSIFRAPHSYTGEESCEISIHGNPWIAKKILELLFSCGVRPADPGEFTKRAFLNGRMDLTQAEAVVDVIEAAGEASLKGARNQLDGLLSSKVSALRSMLIDSASLIELELDFSEEDMEFLSHREIAQRIEILKKEIESLLATYRFGKILKEGVNVALTGKPNVGKSSLLNYLLKESRAIVSPIPGTTRDVLREEMVIQGILFRLFDTAGIRESQDELEKEGVTRSYRAIQEADIVLFINDASQGLDLDLYEKLLQITKKERIAIVMNKIDLACSVPHADARISAKTGEGMDLLCDFLYSKAIETKTYSEKSAIVSNLRHYNNLQKAKESLACALKSLEEGWSGEIVSLDLRNAEIALGEILGTITSDDILNNIFSRFCIGK